MERLPPLLQYAENNLATKQKKDDKAWTLI